MNKTLAKVLRDYVNSELYKVHTNLVAKVVKVSEDGNDVDVQPLIAEVDGVSNRILPTIYAVPYKTPSRGEVGIQWRPEVGDTVLLVINESCLDNVFVSESPTTPFDSRKFNLNDAIALPIDSFTKPKVLDTDTKLSIEANGTTIKIKTNGDIVLNDGVDNAVGFAELLSGLAELQTWFNTHTHTATGGLTSIPSAPNNTDFSSSKVEGVKL